MSLLAARQAKGVGLTPMPGDPGYPVVGKAIELMNGAAFSDLRPYHEHGGVYWTKLMNMTLVSAVSPEAAEQVFLNKDKAFSSQEGYEWFAGAFFGGGLLMLDAEEHRHDKHVMQSAFTRPRLEAYLADMLPTINSNVATWGETGRFTFYDAVKKAALDIATTTFLGAEVGRDGKKLNKAFQDSLAAGTALLRVDVPGTLWHAGLSGRRFLERFLEPRIAEGRTREDDTLLNALITARGEDGSSFSDRAIVNHMIFLLMAAHDTSTTTSTSMAYYLAKHPEWQERCRAESAALGTDNPTLTELESLESLDLVFKESMRMISPLPGIPRRASKDTELCGYFVPKGAYVTQQVQMRHSLPDLWDNPEQFDPERFAAHRREDKRHRFAFTPFGGGVHKCIGMYFGGMEVKALMHRTLLEYSWSVEDGYEMPVNWRSLPFPKDGLPLQLERKSAKAQPRKAVAS